MHNFWTSGQAARALGVTRRTVPNLVRAGVLTPAATAGGAYLFDPDAVAALVAERHAARAAR